MAITVPDDELRIMTESEVPVPLRLSKKVDSNGSNRRRRENKMKLISVDKLWKGEGEHEDALPEIGERSHSGTATEEQKSNVSTIQVIQTDMRDKELV